MLGEIERKAKYLKEQIKKNKNAIEKCGNCGWEGKRKDADLCGIRGTDNCYDLYCPACTRIIKEKLTVQFDLW